MTRHTQQTSRFWATCLAFVLSVSLLTQDTFAQEAPPTFTPDGSSPLMRVEFLL